MGKEGLITKKELQKRRLAKDIKKRMH